MGRLASLPEELCICVFERLPNSALRRTSQVCRDFHDICIPLLFNTIDFSIHNYEPEIIEQRPDKTKAIAIKQFLFLEQLGADSTYARQVREFSWTIGIELALDLPIDIGGVRKICDWPTNVYEVFALLNNATKIDIHTGSDHSESLASLGLKRHPSLFPGAREIRLGGRMHWALASAILHGPDKALLSSLVLNNVQEGGIFASGQNFRMINPHFISPYKANVQDFCEEWTPGFPPRQVGPGCMRRLLNDTSLQSRCSQLRYLSLCKQGQYDLRQPYPGDPATHDNEVYEEWAAFIRITRPATLLLAHGGYMRPPYNGHDPRGYGGFMAGVKLTDDQIAPMDARFRQFLLPVLQKNWPNLTKLVIQGVSRNNLDTLEDKLEGVELVIRDAQ